MCQFITALLPADADLKAVATIFDKHKVGFKQIDNPHLFAQVTPGDVYILTTRSRCDCGTPLGSLAEGKRPKQPRLDNEVGKLRKQGWSESKIERWLEQKGQAEDKQEREQEVYVENATRRLEHWIRFLSDLLRSGHTSRVSLLLLWNGLQDGRISLEGEERVPLANLNADLLLRMKENVVYTFTSR